MRALVMALLFFAPTMVQASPLDDCLAQLPGQARMAFVTPSVRRRYQISPRVKAGWETCLTLERTLHDYQSIRDLQRDLLALHPHGSDGAVSEEALAIATLMVNVTHEKGREYRMVGSPLLNNALIYTGIKKAGYCYEWTTALMHQLQIVATKYFDVVWGVANLKKITENNAPVVTVRGASLAQGIVYDPWRGAGRPYWRSVRGDHYRWTARFARR